MWPPPISSGPLQPAIDLASALSGAMSAMKVSGFIAPTMFGPPPNRSSVLAVARQQRNTGLELGDEIGQIRKLGVIACAAEHDRL